MLLCQLTFAQPVLTEQTTNQGKNLGIKIANRFLSELEAALNRVIGACG